jgi:hypothetical protein
VRLPLLLVMLLLLPLLLLWPLLPSPILLHLLRLLL